ncbi:cutinase transcription factor 1 beta [Fusarium tjaetaba]|uniref:Cutinase transcription factor 1 beta n=1 Tax=Fusarium tjaetaba TaxID=1567544 RepID=A0A8H5S9E6_9HYPO|nr:cutinase transcription factor 1 beta [Fusarium tjaetaba]KAF5646965.1 cutinase transcription factor 1 beta [Fusarium tjaetaba]
MPRPKRQDTRKRSPKNHNKVTELSETETVTKLIPALQQDKTLPTALTDEYSGTPKLGEATARQSPGHRLSQARVEITFAYYPFLYINNLSSLHPDDLNYLDSQGCFKLPESSCLDHLVRAFFQHAHPILPVVNEAEFWSIYDPLTSGDKTGRIPVILLSAMLFVACKYVDCTVLQGMQYSTAHEAQDSYSRKTQLLYHQETESSPLILAQVSLLLAHWISQKSSTTNRLSTQWLGRAIQHSQDAIYQAKVSTSDKSHFNRSNLRRLLGCCIISDCIHSLYTRRPPMSPFGMVEAERDSLVLSRADLSREIGRSRVYDAEAKQRFIEAQEQMSALISILRRVLPLVYPQGGMPMCGTASTLREEEYEALDCKGRLKTWYNDKLMPLISGRDSALGSPVSPDGGTDSQNDPVELLVSMMHLHYEMAMLAICELGLSHLAANSQATYSSYRRYERVSLRRQKDDLANCTLRLTDQLSEALGQQHLSKFPPIMIFCTAPPLFAHLLNTAGHLYNSPWSPVSLIPSRIQDVGARCSRDPQWAREIIKCLGLHFRDELEYILQAVGVVNSSLAQGLQESQEPPILLIQEDETKPRNWRELLDARPRLYIRLIERLNSLISWGGPLAEVDVAAPYSEYQIPSDSTQELQQRKPSWKWIPPVSSAPARRSVKQMTPLMATGNEPEVQLQVSKSDPGCLQLEAVHDIFSDIIMQQMDLPQSCNDEEPGEVYSPTSLETSGSLWVEEITGSNGDVPDHIGSREEIKTTAIEFTDRDDMIIVDGLSDGWIDTLLQSDSPGLNA